MSAQPGRADRDGVPHVLTLSSACNHPQGFSVTCHECAAAARAVRWHSLVLTERGWGVYV